MLHHNTTYFFRFCSEFESVVLVLSIEDLMWKRKAHERFKSLPFLTMENSGQHFLRKGPGFAFEEIWSFGIDGGHAHRYIFPDKDSFVFWTLVHGSNRHVFGINSWWIDISPRFSKADTLHSISSRRFMSIINVETNEITHLVFKFGFWRPQNLNKVHPSMLEGSSLQLWIVHPPLNKRKIKTLLMGCEYDSR